MKKILILQLRPINAAAEGEFQAFLKYGGLVEAQVDRVRMDMDPISHIDPKKYAAVIVGGGPSNISDPENLKRPEQLRFE
ncbi:glutamine amidotransferase, partial [Patescibacteria group bacterium]|nr:glutamine amidotransferase [Patescibacteria group bacterium]